MKDYEIWFKSFKEELEANGIDTSNPYFLSHILVNNNKPIPTDKKGEEYYFGEPDGHPYKDHLKKREELKDNVTYAFMEVDKKGRYVNPRPKKGTSVNWMISNMKKFDEVSDQMKQRLFKMAKENKLYLRTPALNRDCANEVKFIKVNPENNCHITVGIDKIACKRETLAKHARDSRQREGILNFSEAPDSIDCKDQGFKDEDEFAEAYFSNISAFLLDRKLGESNSALMQYFLDFSAEDKGKYQEEIKEHIVNDPLLSEKQIAVIGMLHPDWVDTPEKREEFTKVFGLQKLGSLLTEDELELVTSHTELSPDLPLYEKQLLKVTGFKTLDELMASGVVKHVDGSPLKNGNSKEYLRDFLGSLLNDNYGILLTNKEGEKSFYAPIADLGLFKAIDRPKYASIITEITKDNIAIPTNEEISKELKHFDGAVDQLKKFLCEYNEGPCLSVVDIQNQTKTLIPSALSFLKSVEGRTDLSQYEISRIETAKLILPFMEKIEEASLDISLDIVKSHQTIPRDLEKYSVDIEATKKSLLSKGLTLKEVYAFFDASTKFFNDLKGFTVPDNHGIYKAITEKELQTLKEDFSLFKSIMANAEKKGVSSSILERINKLFPNNISAIENIEADNKKGLTELLNEQVSEMQDARDLVTDSEKGAMSSRIPISTTLPSGEKQPGYFTVNEDFHKKDIPSILSALDSEHPEYGGIFTKLYMDHINEQAELGISKDEAELTFHNKLKYENLVFEGVIKENDNLEQLFENVVEKVKGSMSYNSFYGDILKLEDGETITKRNIALSNVADLLGLGNLVAHSKNMTILKDKKVVNGVFMEAATGKDLKKLLPDDPLINPKVKKIFDSDSVKRDIHNLQLLDFLCFNLDRHMENILYDFKKDEQGNYVLTGIQGIDNDMSFANTSVNTTESYASNMPIFNTLKFIGADLARTLETITPEKLTMAIISSGLGEKTAKFACERLQTIKNLIAEKQIIPVEDGKWKDAPLKANSLFANVSLKLSNISKSRDAINKAKANEEKLKLKEGKVEKKDVSNLDLSDRAFVEGLFTQMKVNFLKLDMVDKPYIRSSRQFKAMRKSMQAIENITQNVLEKTPVNEKVSDKHMQYIRCAYESLLHNCDEYLTVKQSVKPSDLSDYAKSRIKMTTLIKDNVLHVTQLMRKQDEMKTIELNKKQLEMAKNLSKIAKAKENLDKDKIATLKPEEISSNLKSLSEGANYFKNEPTAANIIAKDTIKKTLMYAADNNIKIEKETFDDCQKAIKLGTIAHEKKQVIDAMDINEKKENPVIDVPINNPN